MTAIYTNIPGDKSSQVPGLPGVFFDPGSSDFDRPYGSPNGTWAITANADLSTTMDELLIVRGKLVAQEGTPAEFAPGENVGFLDTKIAVNDAGQYVFTTNTNGPTTADEYVVAGIVGGAQMTVVKEGDSASPPLAAGAMWDEPLDSPVILADGTVGFAADGIDGIPTTNDDVLVIGSTILAQKGITIPTGQIGNEPWENYDINDFFVTPDGLHWLAQGDLTGSSTTDDVVVVDGAVVVQEGVILPGSGFSEPVDSSGIVGCFLAPNGTYFVRGNNDITEQDWVYSNGAVIAAVGLPLQQGALELWDDRTYRCGVLLHVVDVVEHHAGQIQAGR